MARRFSRPLVAVTLVGLLATSIVVAWALGWHAWTNGLRTTPHDPGENDVVVEGRFLYARLERVAASVPARYAARLPGSLEAIGAWGTSHPPKDHVRDGVCLGDGDLRARFAASIAATEATGASWEAICGAYAPFLDRCATPSFCAWIEATLASDAPRAVRHVAAMNAAECVETLDDGWLAANDLPPEVVVGWYERLHLAGGDRPIPPRYVAALTAMVERGPSPCGDLALSLSHFADSDAASLEALLAMLPRAPHDETRRDLVRVLARYGDPRATRIVDAACADTMRREWFCRRRDEPACRSGSCPAPDPEPADADEPLDRDDPDALARCIRDTMREAYGEIDAYFCVHRLAQLDRPRATVLARNYLAREVEPTFRVLASSLVRFPDAASLERRLVEIGLLASPSARLPEGERAPVSPDDLLSERGRLHRFDAEAPGIPVEHDAQLRYLAARVPEVFGGVVFDEEPPRAASPGYRLVAYLAGERFRTRAQDLGDWYDVDAMIGFLNAIARARGASVRFVVLAGPDSDVRVVAADPTAIERAAAEALLPLEPP